MITSRSELDFYLKADLMMNRGYFKHTIKSYFESIVYPDAVMRYLRALRLYEYYYNCGGGRVLKSLY